MNLHEGSMSLDATRNLLIAELGVEQGNRCFAFLWRLCRRQTVTWAWMAKAIQRRSLTRAGLMADAASMLITMAAHTSDLPETMCHKAWADTVNEVYGFAVAMHNGDPRHLLVGDDALNRMVEDLAGEPTPQEPIDQRCLRAKHQQLLSARANGFTFDECGALIRMHDAQAAFRRAVKRLLHFNPRLVERFDLVPCPTKHTGSYCRTCGGWGYTYRDGKRIGGSA